uniref:Uncharacterized protein n=1 Tax=Rhizochromulina marina TaxID=1034831 RepID=A0A7S2SW59_9STRA
MPRIEVFEEDEDGGFDISASSVAPPPPPSSAPAAPPPPPPSARAGESFIPASTFSERMPGFIFTTREGGTGYYKDENGPEEPPVPAPGKEDLDLSYIHLRGVATPHTVEIVVPVGERPKSAADVQVELVDKKLCLIQCQHWQTPVEVPLAHAADATKAQGWLNSGSLTLRLPLRV